MYIYISMANKLLLLLLLLLLREHISAWEALQPPEYVLKIIRQGYILLLTTLPEPQILKNNKSASGNESFVTEAITELLACLSIAMVDKPPPPPLVVNPLSVATNDRGKKRLVLDLRHINRHLHRLRFKCEDVDTAVLLRNPRDFLFAFDIKSAYHHVEIFKDHQQYFDIQWVYNGKLQYLIFRVLPFRLSTAPLVFTKLLKPLLRHWRSSGKRVCMFLDDGLGGSSSLQCATLVSQVVRRELLQVGFILSDRKCFWEPMQTQTWLEHIFEISKQGLF
jgi:hypothetical protein